jgi:cobalt-zinc-cadmium resistance protein CzcA
VMQFGQYNSYHQDRAFQINQNIPFPTYFSAQTGVLKAEHQVSKLQKEVVENALRTELKYHFEHLIYLKHKQVQLMKLDSLYAAFSSVSALRHSTGETHIAEKTTAETLHGEIKLKLGRNATDILTTYTTLKMLMHTNEDFTVQIEDSYIAKTFESTIDTALLTNNPTLKLMQQNTRLAENNKAVELALSLPEINLGYFNQSLIGIQTINGKDVNYQINDRFQVFSIGLGIPLTFFSNSAKIKAIELEKEALNKEADYEKQKLHMQLQNAYQNYLQNISEFKHYKEIAVPNAQLIVQTSKLGFESGDIGYIEYLHALKMGSEAQLNLLDAIHNVNQSLHNIHYLINQ